jgi:hypothetical protein
MTKPKQEQGEPLIWSTTQGGAYVCGEYHVVQRVDDKGWNAHKEHKHILLGASLEDCKSICERDAVESLAKQEPVAYINIEKRRLEWAHDYMSWDTPTVVNLPRIPLYTTLQPAPQGEPVAWMFQHEETGRIMFVEAQQLEYGFEEGNPRLKKISPLYTTPPQRTWVELTDEDDIDWKDGGNLKDLVKAIEAKLKEKNT